MVQLYSLGQVVELWTSHITLCSLNFSNYKVGTTVSFWRDCWEEHHIKLVPSLAYKNPQIVAIIIINLKNHYDCHKKTSLYGYVFIISHNHTKSKRKVEKTTILSHFFTVFLLSHKEVLYFLFAFCHWSGIINSLLQNSDLNWRKQGKPLDLSGMI